MYRALQINTIVAIDTFFCCFREKISKNGLKLFFIYVIL